MIAETLARIAFGSALCLLAIALIWAGCYCAYVGGTILITGGPPQ